MSLELSHNRVSLTQSVPCAICGTEGNYRVRYEESIDPSAVSFSIRHAGRGCHHRIVVCKACGLVYSNPILRQERILQLYREYEFSNEPQFENREKDYTAQLRRILPWVEKRENFLEIGCANGLFLKQAKACGFERVFGVELGEEVIQNADPQVRSWIIQSEFQAGLFPENHFDVVCSFQVLEHILDTNEFFRGIHAILRTGGIVFGVNHNIRSFAARLLGSRGHMYSVEHIYLFDPRTLRRLLEKHHFEVLTIEPISNTYQLGYVARTLPLPSFVRMLFGGTLQRLGMADWTMKTWGGNMLWVARKRKTR